ncbi:hypothetical protein [Bradyrhizobium sp.]|uniref:hypothetical protein n=1 Tax=Bradyrhizobium sp. TaxID=376 RepID=UPI003C3A3B37
MSEEIKRPQNDEVPFPSWQAWNQIVYGEGWACFEHNRDRYESQKAFAAAHVSHTSCVRCEKRFGDDNCFTQKGWQETQISGLCEKCFDEMCEQCFDEITKE